MIDEVKMKTVEDEQKVEATETEENGLDEDSSDDSEEEESPDGDQEEECCSKKTILTVILYIIVALLPSLFLESSSTMYNQKEKV